MPPDSSEIEPQFLQYVDGDALTQPDQAQEQMLGPDEIVVEPVGFLARQGQGLLGARGEISSELRLRGPHGHRNALMNQSWLLRRLTGGEWFDFQLARGCLPRDVFQHDFDLLPRAQVRRLNERHRLQVIAAADCRFPTRVERDEKLRHRADESIGKPAFRPDRSMPVLVADGGVANG